LAFARKVVPLNEAHPVAERLFDRVAERLGGDPASASVEARRAAFTAEALKFNEDQARVEASVAEETGECSCGEDCVRFGFKLLYRVLH
jgi:hypothetical protein